MLNIAHVLRVLISSLVAVLSHSTAAQNNGKTLYLVQNIERLKQVVERTSTVVPISHVRLLVGAVNTVSSLARLEPTTQNAACLDVILQYALRQITICDLAAAAQSCSSTLEREGGKATKCCARFVQECGYVQCKQHCPAL